MATARMSYLSMYAEAKSIIDNRLLLAANWKESVRRLFEIGEEVAEADIEDADKRKYFLLLDNAVKRAEGRETMLYSGLHQSFREACAFLTDLREIKGFSMPMQPEVAAVPDEQLTKNSEAGESKLRMR